MLEDVYRAEQVLHIHGTIGADKNYDPIMGHCNSQEIENRRHLSYDADEAFDEGGASIHEVVANFLREIYKDTDFYISTNRAFFERLHDTNEVIIVGWSAGEVDIPYLQKIKHSVSNDAQWAIYYYDQLAYNSLQKALSECGILDGFDVNFQKSDSFWDMAATESIPTLFNT